MSDSEGGHKPEDSGGDWLDRAARRRAEWSSGVGVYVLIPTMMGVGPVLGYLLGSWVERRIGHAPWPSFAGAVLGAAASVRQIVRILRTYNANDPRNRSRDDGP